MSQAQAYVHGQTREGQTGAKSASPAVPTDVGAKLRHFSCESPNSSTLKYVLKPSSEGQWEEYGLGCQTEQSLHPHPIPAETCALDVLQGERSLLRPGCVTEA